MILRNKNTLNISISHEIYTQCILVTFALSHENGKGHASLDKLNV